MLSIYKREFGESTDNMDCSAASPPDTPGTASGGWHPCVALLSDSVQAAANRELSQP